MTFSVVIVDGVARIHFRWPNQVPVIVPVPLAEVPALIMALAEAHEREASR
jgi:hypothetical protein